MRRQANEIERVKTELAQPVSVKETCYDGLLQVDLKWDPSSLQIYQGRVIWHPEWRSAELPAGK